MKTKNSLNLILVLLFVMICLLPLAATVFFGTSEAVSNEILTPKPKLFSKGEWNPNYLSDFSDWYADHFQLRHGLITLSAVMNEKLFHHSINSDVVLGKDNWLFFESTLNDYMGNGLTDEELNYAVHNLEMIGEYLSSENIDYVFTVAPNKNSIYPDQMLSRYSNQHDFSNLIRLEQSIQNNTSINYCSLIQAFEQQNEKLYFATDSHWNARGAALGADAILNSLGIQQAYFSKRFELYEDHKGDLYQMLFPAGTFIEPDAQCSELDFSLEGNNNNGNALKFSTTSEADRGTLYCWRDSFGISLYPYLADSFSSACFLRATNYDLVNAAEQGADYVIIELVERNLKNLLSQAAIFPAFEKNISDYKLSSVHAIADVVFKDGNGSHLKELHQLSGTVFCPGMDAGSPVLVLTNGRVYESWIRSAENGNIGISLWIPTSCSEITGILAQVNGEYTLFSIDS